MKPDINTLINTINAQQKQINELLRFKDDYYSQRRTVFTYFKNIIQFDRESKIGFFGADPIKKPSAITAPSGGATVDTQARTAISTIITTLQNLGLTS